MRVDHVVLLKGDEGLREGFTSTDLKQNGGGMCYLFDLFSMLIDSDEF